MTEYILIAVLVLFAINEVFNRRERTKLLNRLTAKDYAQYRYYEDKWQGDLKEIKKVRDEDREERKQEAEQAELGQDLSKFEEPWEEEDK